MYCKRGLSNIHATDLPQLIKAGIKGIRSKVGPGRAVKRGHGKRTPAGRVAPRQLSGGGTGTRGRRVTLIEAVHDFTTGHDRFPT